MKKILAVCLVGCTGLFTSQLFAVEGDAEAGKAKSAVCVGCHGANGEGKESPAAGVPAYPKISGQIPGYFVKSMNDYKNGARNDAMMSAIAKGLSDADISNMAVFYKSIK